MPDLVRQLGEFIVAHWIFTALYSLLIGGSVVGAIALLVKDWRANCTVVAALIVLAAALYGGVIYWRANTHECTVTLVNATPFKLVVATAHRKHGDQWETAGWFDVYPGSDYTIARTVRGVTPEFYAYAETRDEQAVGFAYQGWAASDASGAVTGLFYAGNDIRRTVSDPATESYIRLATDGAGHGKKPKVSFEVGMVKVPLLDRDKKTYRLIVQPKDDNFPDLMRPVKGESDVAAIRATARQIASSLSRQQRMSREWGRAEFFPFTLAIEPSDIDHLARGVVVEKSSLLPDGRLNPIEPGDVLVTLNYQSVYGVWDVASILMEHATSEYAGIEEPLTFTVIRKGHCVTGQTSYWFVEEYFVRMGQGIGDGKAMGMGAIDGIVFSFGPEVVAGATKVIGHIGNGLTRIANALSDGPDRELTDVPSYAKLKWQNTQREAMARQWKGDAFQVGQIGSLFVNLPRAAVKVAAPRALSKFAGSRVGAVVFEVAETAVWEINKVDPLRTREELISDLKAAAPWAIGGGVVQGAFGTGRVRK